MSAQPIDLDPFADAMVPRDRWKRPLITTPDGETLPYTRASSLADDLDNGAGLTYWKVQHTALGIARHEDLAAQVAGLKYKDPKLKELIESAIERASDAAAWGTAVHSFTDPDPSPYVPARMVPDVDAYHAKMRELGIEQVESERFVVCDELRVAGTFDGIYEVPNMLLHEAGIGIRVAGTSRVIGDKKTGSIHLQAVGVQTGVYAHGQAYHVEPDGTPVREPLNVRTDVAILIHIPKGEGRCEVYPVDLTRGWADAKLAKAVKDSKDETVPKPLGYVETPKPARKRAAKKTTAPQEGPCSPTPGDAGTATTSSTSSPTAAPAATGGAPGTGTAPASSTTTPAPPAATPKPTIPAGKDGSVTPARAAEIRRANDAIRKQRDLDRAVRNAQPSIADRIATAPTVDQLLALHAETAHQWSDDDKALATARRNLLLHGVTTTPVRTQT